MSKQEIIANVYYDRSGLYKDVDKFIKDGALEIDGKKHYGITDIISHSLGSAVGQQVNNDYGNIFRSRSYGSPFVSNQRPEDTGAILRIRKAGDPVSAFDRGSITLNRGTLDPLQNHSYQDIGNIHNKPGNLPITEEEFYNSLIKTNLNNINNVFLTKLRLMKGWRSRSQTRNLNRTATKK